MPKVSQQYRDARRDQILDAARRCFLRDGFHATSMQDLFAEANLSSGAFYRYFASKDDVIIAIAEDNMRGVLETIRDAGVWQPGRPAGAALADALEIVRTKDAENSLGKIAVLVWAEALRSPAIAARFEAMLTQMRAGFAEVVREGPDDAAADAMAAALVSVLAGYILQLALLGPGSVDGVPEVLRSRWPSLASGCQPEGHARGNPPAPLRLAPPLVTECHPISWFDFAHTPNRRFGRFRHGLAGVRVDRLVRARHG